MRRALLLAAALAIPASGLAVGLSSSPVWAAGAKIVCTTITGTAATTVTISGCSGGNTGGSSQPMSSGVLAAGGTINWVSGSKTTLNAPTLTATSAKHCPGYVKNGTSNPSADKANATVTGDTGDGIKVPGKAQGSVCIYPNGSVSALKPFKIT
jgi:hypothetical protein